VTDVAMDPVSPESSVCRGVPASAHRVRGRPAAAREGGILQTTDAARPGRNSRRGCRGTREAGTKPAPPTGKPDTGRQESVASGLCVYRKDPSIVYALVEHGQRRHLRSDARAKRAQDERHEPDAPDVLQPGRDRSQQRPARVGARAADVLPRKTAARRSRTDLARDPRRLPRRCGFDPPTPIT